MFEWEIDSESRAEKHGSDGSGMGGPLSEARSYPALWHVPCSLDYWVPDVLFLCYAYR